jgi:hypothetical protein
MFKFSAYPPASFWDTSKLMLHSAGVPAPQEQDKKPPADKDRPRQDQQIAAVHAFKFL